MGDHLKPHPWAGDTRTATVGWVASLVTDCINHLAKSVLFRLARQNVEMAKLRKRIEALERERRRG